MEKSFTWIWTFAQLWLFCNYLILLKLYNVGEVHCNRTTRSAVEIETENQIVQFFLQYHFINLFIYFSLGICLAGKYSTNNGVCPCKRCPYGTYQENEQMTTCKACPTGTTTTYTGSKSISDCVGKFTNNLYHLCPEHREMWSKAIWLWLQRHSCPDWPDSHVISVTRFPLNSAFLANVN